MLRKIEAMHKEYGCIKDKQCKTCCNLLKGNYHGKSYNKCIAYGLSHSEATDWKISNEACGLHDKPFDSKKNYTMLDRIKRSSKDDVVEVMEGQLSF